MEFEVSPHRIFKMQSHGVLEQGHAICSEEKQLLVYYWATRSIKTEHLTIETK